MDDAHIPFEEVSGLERMNYQRFYNTYVVRRPGQAPSKFDTWDQFLLPSGSVFHTLNGFDTLVAPNDGLPATDLPPIVHEKMQIMLLISSFMAVPSSYPFGVKETMVYRPNRISSLMNHFYQTHRHYNRILSPRTIGTFGNSVLTWLDYSPLNEARLTGTLHMYRKFDALFRTILNNICQIGDKTQHFIHLPQSGHVFGRPLLQRTYSELSNATLKALEHDPSIYPIIHVLGYIYARSHKLDVRPYKEDVLILGKKADELSELPSTSYFERIPKYLFPYINFVFQHGNRAVVYNLGDIDTFSQDPSFYMKFYRHMMNLRLSAEQIPDHIDPDSDHFDTLVHSLSDDKETPTEQDVTPPVVEAPQTHLDEIESQKPVVVKVSTQPVTPIHHDAGIHIEQPVDKPNFEHTVRQASADHQTSILTVEPKKEKRHNELLEQHLNVSLNGKPVGAYLQAPAASAIVPKQMDYIKSAPEVSYKTSSLLAMDSAYLEHGYHHDLAKVLASTAKHGLYIQKIEEDKTHTEMDRTTTYKINLTDLQGRSHHIKFTLPDVDHNGLMKLSGVEYRLTRQIANVPICKISPTRVNLSSYFNKVIVERVQSKRFSYEEDMSKFILRLRAEGLLEASVGSAPLPTQKVPYDYSALGRRFTRIQFKKYDIRFGANHADTDDLSPDRVTDIQKTKGHYGVFVGTGPDNSLLFWDQGNQIHLVNDQLHVKSWTSFQTFLADTLGEAAINPRTTYEWTQANIINQTIPLIFILSHHYGLKDVLSMIKLDYTFYPTGTMYSTKIDDMEVKLADGTLVFNRYPLSRSLIAAGLLWTSLKDFTFNELGVPETYGRVFQQKKMTVGVLKGLSPFFTSFVDPMTESVLHDMNEPITFTGLLLKANLMLTDYYAQESSSIANHRFRLYERFCGMVYNEIFRSLANHRNNPSSKPSFSINPEAVFQKTVQDATIAPNDVTNPVHEIKQKANYTFTGGSGRTGNSFVLRDRIYPKDGLGVVSDAVPDSGKVGITSYLSASPRIHDIHGLATPYKEGDHLEPPEMLAVGTMVMPCATTDDGKRAAYTNIQISHYVPNVEDGETLAVRTGYDEVVPHLSSDVFAVPALDDGVVLRLDTKHDVLTVKYNDTAILTDKSLKLPYLDSLLDNYRHEAKSVGYLIPDTEISHYPNGSVFRLTKTTLGKVTDRLRCETLDAIPDKDSARKQNSLIQEFNRGKYKALYFIRFQLISHMQPGDVKSYSFKKEYTPISGSYLLQKRIPNVVVGETFKKGDILIYNEGFFCQDPMSKQVTFKHGVTANVVLMDTGKNHEDACEISRDFSRRLKMTPCHQREIVLSKTAAVLAVVKLGDRVETSDSLCVISDEYLVGSTYDLNPENLDIIEKLNRQTPSAGYSGTIRKIRMLYGCDKDQLSESLKRILKVYEKEVKDQFQALNNDPKAKPPEKPGWVAPGTKYHGIDFTTDTVILEFMIEETLDVVEGDKIVLGLQAKSIISHVTDTSHVSESGTPIDVVFSTTSVLNRIVASTFSIGIVEKNMDKLKENILKMYFDEK